jgi:hypothetical protein
MILWQKNGPDEFLNQNHFVFEEQLLIFVVNFNALVCKVL